MPASLAVIARCDECHWPSYSNWRFQEPCQSREDNSLCEFKLRCARASPGEKTRFQTNRTNTKALRTEVMRREQSRRRTIQSILLISSLDSSLFIVAPDNK